MILIQNSYQINDGHISIKEAFDYAHEWDITRKDGNAESVMDDNGNGLPTYINNGYSVDNTDGSKASTTFIADCEYAG